MMLTKNKLIEIAKEMDIKGIAKLTKQQLIDYIINNPCVNLTREECEKMKREELRAVARKCNVLLGKKNQSTICNEIITKFSNKKKTLIDLDSKVSSVTKKKTQPAKKNVVNNKMVPKKALEEIFKSDSIVVQSFDKPPIIVSKTGEIEINKDVTVDGEPPSSKSSGKLSSLKSSGTPPSTKSSGTPASTKSSGTPPSSKSSGKLSSLKSSGTPASSKSKSSGTPASSKSSGTPASTKSKSSGTPASTKSPSSSSKSSKQSTTKSKIVSTIQFSSNDEPIKEIKPELPKAKKQDAQSFPQIEKEIKIETNVEPKEVVKQIIEQELGSGKSTNFTDSSKINKPGAKAYTTKTCNIQVDALKPLSKNSGISGAGIFLGMMKAVNKQSPNVVLKLWKYNTKTGLYKQLECLSAEWNIYTYIIPFMFFKNLTPCVLFPIESGTCKKQEMEKVLSNVKMTYEEVAKFTITPYIQYSLVDIFNSKQYNNQIDVRNMIFQLIYTIGAFNKMGLRHNDCHTNNIRIVPCPTNPFKICFKLKNTQVYAIVPFLAVFNDFDRTSIGMPISDVTKLKNPCTAPGGYYCNYIHQCDAPVGGARDLLIIIFYMYDGMDPELKQYFYQKVFTGTATAKKRLNAFVGFKKDGNVNWSKTDHGSFLFTKLNDYLLTKAYPGVDTILNDPQFLDLCFASSTMKPSSDDTSSFKVYDFYNVNIIEEYPKFKESYYE